MLEKFFKDAYGNWSYTKIIAWLLMIIIGISVFFMTMLATVGVGYVGILVNPVTGTIRGPVKGPIWFIKLPWEYKIDIYYAMDSVGMWTEWKEEAIGQFIEVARGDYPAIHAISKDGLSIEVDILVRWSLDPNKVIKLFLKFPMMNWKDTVICSVIREEVRDVISKFTAIEIIEQRSLIVEELYNHIKHGLTTEESLVGAIVEGTLEVDLRDIDPPVEFLDAIKQKLAAEQAMIQAEFERQTVMIMANATAQEYIITAEGEAKAKIIKAEAMKEAIALIAEAANMDKTEIAKLYITLEALKEISEETGQMIVLLVIGEDGVPILYPIQTP